MKGWKQDLLDMGYELEAFMNVMAHTSDGKTEYKLEAIPLSDVTDYVGGLALEKTDDEPLSFSVDFGGVILLGRR